MSDWRAEAACRGAGPALWFPEPPHNAPDAKAVCRKCPVRAECLDYALSCGPMPGVWGGTSERERRGLRRARRGVA